MALYKIDPKKPICQNFHRTLINRIRTNVRLEHLIKNHSQHLLGVEVKDLPTLWGKSGVPFRKQIDLALGLASMKPRHRDGLVNLFDKEADKRWELNQKLRDSLRQISSLKRQPFNTLEEQEILFSEVAELKTTVTALEGQLTKLPEPKENGAIEQCFLQSPNERLVDEGFIAFTGSHSYEYHLTPKTIEMITAILNERDRIQGLVDRQENLDEDEVDMLWFTVKKKIPKVKKIK